VIDVLVPILGRSPLEMLRTLGETTTVPHAVFFICSPGDEMVEVCRSTGHVTWVVEWEPGRADFARKINWAYEHTESPWIFQGADDIRFYPNWDVAAISVAYEKGAQVIGTNDLHNPGVKVRATSTHTLIAREYIERCGGTCDGTGAIFSEAYDHQFVDNELIELAKLRGTWAFAEHSIVEHLHPVWNLAEWDETYLKAFRETEEDTRLFNQRRRMFKRAALRR